MAVLLSPVTIGHYISKLQTSIDSPTFEVKIIDFQDDTTIWVRNRDTALPLVEGKMASGFVLRGAHGPLGFLFEMSQRWAYTRYPTVFTSLYNQPRRSQLPTPNPKPRFVRVKRSVNVTFFEWSAGNSHKTKRTKYFSSSLLLSHNHQHSKASPCRKRKLNLISVVLSVS